MKRRPSIDTSVALALALAVGCGPGPDTDDTANDGTSTGSPSPATDSGTTAETEGQDATTTADDSSGGPEPIDPCDASIAMGIVGIAITIECDAGPPEECEHPSNGLTIGVYAEDPRVTVDEFFPSALDPAILPVAQTVTDMNGRFEVEVTAGTWVLCAVSGDSGFCQTNVIIDDAQPLRRGTYYSGNGDSWSVGTCPVG